MVTLHTPAAAAMLRRRLPRPLGMLAVQDGLQPLERVMWLLGSESSALAAGRWESSRGSSNSLGRAAAGHRVSLSVLTQHSRLCLAQKRCPDPAYRIERGIALWQDRGAHSSWSLPRPPTPVSSVPKQSEQDKIQEAAAVKSLHISGSSRSEKVRSGPGTPWRPRMAKRLFPEQARPGAGTP